MKLKRFFWNTAPLAIIYILWVCVFYLALGGRDDLPSWISSWAKWDSVWYEKIWNNGYQADLKALVFPPGYSVLVGSTSGWLKLNFGTAAVLVNLICFFAVLFWLQIFWQRSFKLIGVFYFCSFLFHRLLTSCLRPILILYSSFCFGLL